MNSAQYFESNLPSTSKKSFLPDLAGLDVGTLRTSQTLFRAPFPGRHAAGRPAPSPATWPPPRQFTTGRSDNLIGIETFSGSKDNQSPQHAVLLGMRGAGKSVTVCDLLSQTEGYFAYTVIIEEGLVLRHLHRDRRGRRAAHHHSSRRRPDHQLSRHERTAAHARPSCPPRPRSSRG